MLAEHQLVAVARIAELIDECGGAILADEPGLGKSFVAAACAAGEEGVEVIVPASLRSQWAETLSMFGATARILTHDGIIGDPFVPQPQRRLVIVDEAHGFRNPRTQRYAALARRTAGAGVLLLTATPICNSVDDLKALIDLVTPDDGLAARGLPSIDSAFERRDPEAIAAIVSALVIRRTRGQLPEHLQFGSLRRRVIRHPANATIDAAIDALQFPLVAPSAILRQFLRRRLESSPAALMESLRRQRRFYERALECFAAGRTLPKREYRRVFAHEEDADAFQRVLFWEVFVPQTTSASAAVVEDEMRRIDELMVATGEMDDPKRETLIDLIGSPGEPVLVFSGWAATAADLCDALRARRRVALATGRARDAAGQAIEAFRRGEADVLVSTDLGAEGLNLQRAGMVIHYDIPWNPVKLEQRDGRAHRIGQQRDSVEAVYFIPEGRDSGVMPVVVAKNRARRRVLSGAARAGDGRNGPRSATLRPRVTAGAAIVPFIRAVEASGFSVPDELVRRHRAGLERLLLSMSGEFIDAPRLADLAALAELEPWGRSRLIRFAHL
ncbi:MAG TPA: helicase-related protein [Thermoanaerobaculia bacterium]|nr:helicase-related protein [Thermoanaerobaculia bacterium]